MKIFLVTFSYTGVNLVYILNMELVLNYRELLSHVR